MGRVASLVCALIVLLGPAAPARADVVELSAIFANAGFEDDLVHSGWTATVKNGNYVVGAVVVAPVIVPFGTTQPLQAPAGSHFVGVSNPHTADVNGRVVHEVASGPFAAGTVFTVTVFANRGRLPGAGTAIFNRSESEVTLQLFGWLAGSKPVINPLNDDWSRKPKFTLRKVFTDWPANGEWGTQTFEFLVASNVQYVSLAVTGKNHKDASYVAFDILIP